MNAPKPQTHTLTSLGPLGDGMAMTHDGPIYVPFALPGETVRTTGTGTRRELEALIEPSPDRTEPVCKFFGTCGGCQLQHLASGPYLEWKRSLLISALGRESLECDVAPILAFGGPIRRRASFTLRGGPEGLTLGFSEKGTHNLLDLDQCPVMAPAISDQMSALKAIGAKLLSGSAEVRLEVTACDNGLDLNVVRERAANANERQSASQAALEHGLLRLCLNAEVLIERERPLVRFGKWPVPIPPGGFIQAVGKAEEHMADLVTGHMKSCKRVADLFCGSGTFALRLAERAIVQAYEFDQPALDALASGWRASGGKLKNIDTHKRELFRAPLTFLEMKKIDGVVFDPPRAGAEAQAVHLAKSKVKKIAAVSCNPQTLARDLKILVDGGYRIKSITPIDQFQYTPHLEIVALLER